VGDGTGLGAAVIGVGVADGVGVAAGEQDELAGVVIQMLIGLQAIKLRKSITNNRQNENGCQKVFSVYKFCPCFMASSSFSAEKQS